jgi:transposase
MILLSIIMASSTKFLTVPLLVVGATSVTRRAPTTNTRTGAWVRSLLERKPTRLVTVAIANKTARTAWALLAKGETYRAAPAI